jgi:N,N'-diacetylchitobiose transport system substrate-binding protein
VKKTCLVAACVTVALAAAACSSSGTAKTGTTQQPSGSVTTGNTASAPVVSSGSGSTPAVNGQGRTLMVWLMQGDLSDAIDQSMTAAFEKATGAKVNLQIQQWDNINTKVITALAQDTPPDVVEIGNTDVPLFAANGGLMDITAHKAELAGVGRLANLAVRPRRPRHGRRQALRRPAVRR